MHAWSDGVHTTSATPGGGGGGGGAVERLSEEGFEAAVEQFLQRLTYTTERWIGEHGGGGGHGSANSSNAAAALSFRVGGGMEGSGIGMDRVKSAEGHSHTNHSVTSHAVAAGGGVHLPGSTGSPSRQDTHNNSLASTNVNMHTTSVGGAGGRGHTRAPSTSLSARRAAAIRVKCAPLLQSELTWTRARVQVVRAFIATVVRAGKDYMQRLRDELWGVMQSDFVAEAAAINAAVWELRRAIEEERAASAMQLSRGSFGLRSPPPLAEGGRAERRASMTAADAWHRRATAPPSTASFLTDVPVVTMRLSQPAMRIHAGLTAARLMELIEAFRVMAPDYQLARADFVMQVSAEDCGGGGGDAAAEADADWVGRVFDCFDEEGTGVVDFREVVVHLLFYTAAPPASPHTRRGSRLSSSLLTTTTAAMNHTMRSRATGSGVLGELTLPELRAMRRALGEQPLTCDAFDTMSLPLSAHLTRERWAVYRCILWAALHEPATGRLDPWVLLYFMCSDVQPVRGVQKAFVALARVEERRVGEGAGDADVSDASLTLSEMDRVFHTSAVNARALGRYDPFARSNLRLVLHAEGAARQDEEDVRITFAELCSNVVGRKLINSATMFRRKNWSPR